MTESEPCENSGEEHSREGRRFKLQVIDNLKCHLEVKLNGICQLQEDTNDLCLSHF